jgi:hypothetical protein
MIGMKRTVVLLNLALCYFSASTAQTTFHSAIGLRIGTGNYDFLSASYKTIISGSASAIEPDFGVKPATDYHTGYCVPDGNPNTMISFSASYQYCVPIAALPGLQLIMGGGAVFSGRNA